MKNRILNFLFCVVCILTVIGYKDDVNATGQYFENNKNSIVQVVMSYTADDGTRYILQSGSGIVINSNTILTNRHVVHISNANMKKAKKLTNVKDLSRDSIAIGIVKQDDVLINATISQESQEKDFALLTLEELTDRTPAVLGTSSTAVAADRVTAIGYPTTKPFSKEGAQLFAPTGTHIIPGIIAEVGLGNITVSGTISSGNSGGALVNDNTGEVIGLLVYKKQESKSGTFSVLPIDDLKNPYLAGTSYTDGSIVASTEAAPTEEVPVEETTEAPTVDKTLLQKTVDSALALNSEDYTEASYLHLYGAIKDAQYVLDNEAATQEEVDRALTALQDGKQSLAIEKGINWVLIVCIILAVLVVIAIVVVIIVLVNMKKKEKERNQFKVVPQGEIEAAQSQINIGPSDEFATASEKLAHSVHNYDTMPLNSAGMNQDTEGTTVLTQTPSLHPYLIRIKNGERRDIDAREFVIGQDPSRVNYCITDNITISRCHMKIITEGIRFYAMDLGSTNRTYVNGAVIPPNQKFEIKNGDSIRISDEEFTFEVK